MERAKKDKQELIELFILSFKMCLLSRMDAVMEYVIDSTRHSIIDISRKKNVRYSKTDLWGCM